MEPMSGATYYVFRYGYERRGVGDQYRMVLYQGRYLAGGAFKVDDQKTIDEGPLTLQEAKDRLKELKKG